MIPQNIAMPLIILQIIVLAGILLSKKWENKGIHYLVLTLISTILLAHIFSYYTECEDIYISLRYVKNFVEGKGLVFNTFDKVEGYSDFLWVMLIAAVHKITQFDIPLIARYLSLFFSVVVLWYTYIFAFSVTANKLLSYLSAFLVSISPSFACYGLAGLENPLFALLILLIINFTLQKRWWLVGLLIGLNTMTRPEGFIMYFPLALYILLSKNSLLDKCKQGFIVGSVAAVTVLPWTIWRVSYYGYFVPNTIAAKEGMALWYQIKLGLVYSTYFLVIISESLLFLIILPVLNKLFIKNSTHNNWLTNHNILLGSSALMFIAFYSYAGGDWMPGWRFYASVIPLFSIVIALLWKEFVFAEQPVTLLKSKWIVLIFMFCGYIQVRNTFMNDNLLPLVNMWRYQVTGLKFIGKWLKNTLPDNTLIATFPNGAFSYYNELPTIDFGGLTDNNVGRYGEKIKVGGRPGHIASNHPYVLSKKPAIIAIMNGAGFVGAPSNEVLFNDYEICSFDFINYSNPNGEYVNLFIRKERKAEILAHLLKDKNVRQINP